MECVDPLRDPQERLESKERQRILYAALNELSERQREALYLRELDGLDNEQVGGRLGLGPGAVRAVLFRARRSLKEHLDPVREGL